MNTYLLLSAAVVGLMAADVASGAALAISRGDFRSAEMRAGFWRKLAELAALFGLVGAEHIARVAGVDLAAPFGFLGGAAYIATMETASVIENMKAAAGAEDNDMEGSAEDGKGKD